MGRSMVYEFDCKNFLKKIKKKNEKIKILKKLKENLI